MTDTPVTTYQGQRFGTAISCMDGRCLDAVSYALKSRFGVHHVDTITEPGMVARLSEGHEPTLASVRRCLDISVRIHGSPCVAVVGHHDCAGNPVPRDRQEEQIAASCELVRSWGFPVQIVGLYINELWQAEVVCESLHFLVESKVASVPES